MAIDREYAGLDGAREEVREFMSDEAVGNQLLLGLVLVARTIDSLTDQVEEANRLLTIIANNTGG